MVLPINHPTIDTTDVIRPTHVEVSLSRLTSNFENIKSSIGTAKIMPVLKANAYGHGMVETAKHFQNLNADYLGVAVLEEGLLLRQKGITAPILVMGGIIGNQVPHFIKNNLTITASSIGKLEQINSSAGELGTKAKVHLKIDTGLERIGVHYYNAEKFILAAAEYENIIVEGIFSHFANSSSSDLSHARLQIERFTEVLSSFEKHNIPRPEFIHMANSGAILQLPEAHFNLVRPGILLYGVYPSEEVKKSIKVLPALSWKSRVVYFKVIKPGHPVGYGSIWETEKNTRAVTVPVGYGDGYFRSMTGKAQVVIRDKRHPVVGTISMDQVVIDIGYNSAYNEDEVILIGESQNTKITCEDLAGWAETIPYEVLTNINTRVPRIYTE